MTDRIVPITVTTAVVVANNPSNSTIDATTFSGVVNSSIVETVIPTVTIDTLLSFSEGDLLSRLPSEDVAASERLYLLFDKKPLDTAITSEFRALSISKASIDTAAAGEMLSFLAGRNITDTSTATELVQKTTGLTRSDTSVATDSGNALKQNYVSGDYFGQDYTGTSYNF